MYETSNRRSSTRVMREGMKRVADASEMKLWKGAQGRGGLSSGRETFKGRSGLEGNLNGGRPL